MYTPSAYTHTPYTYYNPHVLHSLKPHKHPCTPHSQRLHPHTSLHTPDTPLTPMPGENEASRQGGGRGRPLSGQPPAPGQACEPRKVWGAHVCYHAGVTPGPGRGMGHRTPGFLEEAHVTSPDAISSPCCRAELCRAGQNPRVHPDTRPWHPEKGQSWWRQWGQPLGSAWGGDGSPPELNIPSLGGWDGIPGNHPAGLATHPSTESWGG